MSRSTVVFDFRMMEESVLNEVREIDIHRFFKELGLNAGVVRAIDSDDLKRFGQVRVTMKSVTLADDLVSKCKTNEPKMRFQNSVYPVNVDRSGRRPVVVQLRKIPGEATSEDIKKELQVYGTVLNIRRKVYSGDEFIQVYTGRATALMYIETPIPPSINIFGGDEKINVFYPEQPKACYICHDETHEAKDCPRNRRNMRKNSVLSPNPIGRHFNNPWGTPRTVVSQPSGSSSALEGIRKLTPSMAVDLILKSTEENVQKDLEKAKENEKAQNDPEEKNGTNQPKKPEEVQKRTLRPPTAQKPSEGVQKQGGKIQTPKRTLSEVSIGGNKNNQAKERKTEGTENKTKSNKGKGKK